MRRTLFLRAGCVLGALLLLPGCGAGLITGVGLSQGGSSAEVRPPGLAVQQLLPLVPTANSTRTVTVTNAQLAPGARLRVEITALGERDVQLAPQASAQGGSTAITFTMVTDRIRAAVANPTAADIAGQLQVFVDDKPIAQPVAVTLVRQVGVAVELPSGGTVLVLPPDGGSATLRVRGLRGTGEGQLQMFVRTRDPEDTANELVRVCFGLTVTPVAGTDEALLTALVPGTGTPDRAQLFVRDAIAGDSTEAVVFYRPEVTLVLPSQGPTTGGSLVTAIGTALVPRDFTVQPAPLAFDRVDLAFAKGGRVVELPRSDFREELSSADRVVFRMPPSPDGRPGQVDIVLTAHLDGYDAEFVAEGRFLYANPRPFFGPRGAVLDTSPVAVAPIALDAPGSDEAPDFAVLTDEGGTAFLQLLLAQENGMFLRFGAARQIGDHEVAAEREPRDLCAADFDGDQVPDLFVVNAGAATAVHDLVLGQAPPLSPLGAVHRFAGDPGMSRCRVGDFDGDGLADILLVPGPSAPAGAKPEVMLSRPLGVGLPAFLPPIQVDVRALQYDAVEVADLDGDGVLDVAVVDGVQLKLDVAYGNGDGTFGVGVPLDFTIQVYTPDPGSTAIGLHACGNGPLQSLGLVLSGDDDGFGADPDPVVAALHQVAARVFAPPVSGDVQVLGTDPLGASLVTNLDGPTNPEFELVVGVRGERTNPQIPSNGVLRFTDGHLFFPVSGGVEVSGEPPRRFRSLHFGRAFPATQQAGEAKAVFALHDSQIDGATERRLSTLLLFGTGSGLTLLPPDAGVVWASPVQGIVGGNWSGVAVEAQGSVRDLALARAGGVDLVANDGFGGQPSPADGLQVTGLLPRSVTLLPSRTGGADGLVGFDASARLWFWQPRGTGQNQVPQALSADLRLVAADPVLQTTPLADTTRVRLADVDGDGEPDLVALLRFQLANPGPEQALLVVMCGKAAPAAGELPFFAPSVATAVPGLATSFALGDFAPTVAGVPRRLELALAVPTATTAGGLDGDHVRFYRFEPGSAVGLARFVASAGAGPQVLQAGSRPTRLAAGDFDRDGLDDLLVAVAGDSSLREFRNTALPSLQPGDVDIGAFFETPSARRAMAPGEPVDLRLGDVDGDGAIDALIAVESTTGGVRSTSLAFYLSTEPGAFGEATTVSPTRLGNRDAGMVLDLGDWNRDGVLDLFVGWDTAGQQDRNVRVLFGGSR